MTQCSNQKKKVLNFIAVIGFILAIISIPFCPLCIGQILAFIISIVGYADAKKCNNRGKILGMLGIIISLFLIIVGPFMLYLMIKGMLQFVLMYDWTSSTLFFESLGTTLRFIVILLGYCK